MSRVYTSYSEEEFALISNECEQYGMTHSAFQKYCVLLYLGQNAEEIKKIDIEEMKQIMNQELNNKKVGDKFIVSALLPPEKWSNLNRSQKITLSLYLKNIIENCSDRFRVCDILHNNIKQYERYKSQAKEKMLWII